MVVLTRQLLAGFWTVHRAMISNLGFPREGRGAANGVNERSYLSDEASIKILKLRGSEIWAGELGGALEERRTLGERGSSAPPLVPRPARLLCQDVHLYPSSYRFIINR